MAAKKKKKRRIRSNEEMDAVEPIYGLIGERIAAGRQALDLSQEALAANLGVSVKTIVRWETGKRRINPHVLDALAELFECDLRDLLP